MGHDRGQRGMDRGTSTGDDKTVLLREANRRQYRLRGNEVSRYFKSIGLIIEL